MKLCRSLWKTQSLESVVFEQGDKRLVSLFCRMIWMWGKFQAPALVTTFIKASCMRPVLCCLIASSSKTEQIRGLTQLQTGKSRVQRVLIHILCLFMHVLVLDMRHADLLANFWMACSFRGVFKVLFKYYICILPPGAVHASDRDIQPEMGRTCSGYQSRTKTLNHVSQIGKYELSRN